MRETPICCNRPFMKMTLKQRAQAALIWFLLNTTLSYGVESDVECLKSIKESLRDPNEYLRFAWNFDNKTEGSICRFNGIECWHPDESKVLNIRLSDMGLEGEFPQGLEKCSSLTGLDLSRNKLRGNIPSNISSLLHFVTNLDLSSNELSGEIPSDLANCTYLYVLNLDNNKLTGKIPADIINLRRMKSFNVSNNKLTGPIPNFIHASFPAESFANNGKLCGYHLRPCSKKRIKVSIGIIVGAAVSGFTVSAVLMLACCLIYVESRDRK